MKANAWITALCAALMFFPAVSHARLAELLSEQIAEEVQDLVMNDLIAMNQEQLQDGQPAPDNDGPILGMPTLDQLAQQRLMNVWMNPTYWSTWVQEALVNGNVQIP